MGTVVDMRPAVADRLAALRSELQASGAAAALVGAPANQTYLTGFRALLYSRPITLLVTPEATALVVPGLEEQHARDEAAVDELRVYYEHPNGSTSCSADLLDAWLGGLPRASTIAVEHGSCPVAVGQHLTAAGHRLVDLDAALARMREVKEPVEVELIREAAAVTGAGVAASLAACTPGVTEIEVDGAGTAAVMAGVARFGGAVTVEQLIMTPSGRRRSILPHVHSGTRRLADGDVLIHTRQVGLNGYRAELERTAFVGRCDDEQQRVFEVVRRAQQAAIQAVMAGVECRRVDDAARRVIADAGLGAHAIHRSGHGIGLSPHEPPYLRFDDDSRLREGMVITIEPGVYVPGLGGFRHSDTVLVTRDGHEPLTEHPADLESLVLT